MKRTILIICTIVLLLFTSCNPDSNRSILYDMLHAVPSTDYRINTYVGDLGDHHIILGTDKGITAYNLKTNSDQVIVGPIARPLFVINPNGSNDTYVLYYEQNKDQDAAMKTVKVTVNNGDTVDVDGPFNAEFYVPEDDASSTNAKQIHITTVYSVANQDNGHTAYTFQEREETNNVANEQRSINFYRFLDSQSNKNFSLTVTEGIYQFELAHVDKATASSNSDVAPYIIGDGYIAYLDNNESYYKVFDIRNHDNINSGMNGDDNCPDNEILAFYGALYSSPLADNSVPSGYVLVDNSGNIYTKARGAGWDSSKPDYGSFPMDNRRVAYATYVKNDLYVAYKYGPEVLKVNNDRNITVGSTSDVNDEDIVGFKYYNKGFYVITEEAGVIRTNFT